MKKFFLILHLFVGLCSAGVLVVLSISGTIIAFEPELNRLMHPELTNVKVTGAAMNWDQVKRQVEEQAPAWKLIRFYFPDRPDLSTYVRIRSVETHRIRQIYVDQYTGK